MILSVYNALSIPFSIGFGFSYSFLQWNEIIDDMLDLVFLFDNIIMFFTSFQDIRGKHIFNHYKIFKNYVRTWRFVFDTLSLFGSKPFREIDPAFKYFKMFKAIRVFRLGSLI